MGQREFMKFLNDVANQVYDYFFTSDLHFSHKNIIPSVARPFKDLIEMHIGKGASNLSHGYKG